MDPEVAAELKEIMEVEIQASQPGSDIVLQGRHDAFAQVRGRDKGGRVRCLGNELQAAMQRIAELEAHVAHHGLGTANTVTPSTELQAAMQRIAELEALVAHHGLGTANTVTPSTDAEIRNSP
ncbi:hypothetical protein MKW98_008748 [Papaver atlanticum]|uniref:Uncharacterized protein n=1 Tax=Papaver atlanticum TaxID=357466 RepID=A0AAD4XUG6_9MAGN|nr:hypothetical protein MKW98_008748 [Papaver atlanticum]